MQKPMVGAVELGIMSNSLAVDREQLKRLDQESLIELILALQAQLAAQQVMIQELQDQLAKDVTIAASHPAAMV